MAGGFGQGCYIYWKERNEQLEELKKIVEERADINKEYGYGWTLLHRASAEGHLGIVKELMNHNANITADNDNQRNPLHHACEGAYKDIVEVLLTDRTYNIDCKDIWQMTPLHAACQRGSTSEYGRDLVGTVKILLENGADVNARCEDENTPLHYICKRTVGSFNKEVARLLLEYGADTTIKNNSGETPFDSIQQNLSFDVTEFIDLCSSVDWKTEEEEWNSTIVI